MTDKIALDLWAAIDAGDDGAYDALMDLYLEAGLDRAAEGVRRARPSRRRPYKWAHGELWNWCQLEPTLGPEIRSAVRFGDASDGRIHPTEAWELLAAHPEPLL